MTRRGVDWINGKVTVPKYVRVYDGKPLNTTGVAVSMADALGDEFSSGRPDGRNVSVMVLVVSGVEVLVAQRDGSVWELKRAGSVHWTVGNTMREGDGKICLHGNRGCGRMVYPVALDWAIVETLWEKDVRTGAAHCENGVDWCMSCCVREVTR